MSFLKCSNVFKSFGSTSILKGINLEFEKGEQCSIVGASGSGKSSLLYLLGGLDSACKGDIFIDGNNLSEMNDDKLAMFRNQNIGFVFQFHFLLPTMTCLQNMMLPSIIKGGDSSAVKDRVLDFSKQLGVDNLLKRHPYEISGGEQQRINLIRALSLKPSLLLCDEPTGNLDSKNSDLVSTFLLDLSKEENTTLIVVTHDLNVASHFKRKIKIEDGLIIS
jgi:ABC-type lipoprotein export system ATPase subunit